MPEVELDAETHDKLLQVAADTGEPVAQVAAKWLNFGLDIADMRCRIHKFSSLSEQERKDLADQAGDFATGAQLMALDAEDGGYDWGPNGPPGDDR